MSRRQAISAGAALVAGVITSARGRAAEPRTGPRAAVAETRVISHQPELYHGWPTLARRRNGQLLLVYSGGREGHICPFGRVELMQSNDDGRTWTFPRVLLDSAIDDRDAGVLETPKGTLLVTTFSSLAYEPMLTVAEGVPAGQPGAWPPERLRRWQGARDRLTAAERKADLGVWMLRSTDGGRTWSARYPSVVNSPHGPVALSDGRLLYAGKTLYGCAPWQLFGVRAGVCESRDDGQTWQWLAEIPTKPGYTHDGYDELHAVETTDGRLVVQIRNENETDRNETLQCESSDGGKTWSVPHRIGVWGLPSHLLRLKDGRLLMTYGHRRPPFGNQARVSEDQGRTWFGPMIISGDGAGGDLGYPSTVQLADGTLLTVWYELMKQSPRAVLRQARWTLDG